MLKVHVLQAYPQFDSSPLLRVLHSICCWIVNFVLLLTMYVQNLISLALAASFCINLSLAQQLPQVDLGYETHQAISYNVRALCCHELRSTNDISLPLKSIISPTFATRNHLLASFGSMLRNHPPVEILSSKMEVLARFARRLLRRGVLSGSPSPLHM